MANRPLIKSSKHKLDSASALVYQAKLKEAEDAAAELAAKLDAALEEKRQLEQRIMEFTQTLAERDELIAQLRAGNQVGFILASHPPVLTSKNLFSGSIIIMIRSWPSAVTSLPSSGLEMR